MPFLTREKSHSGGYSANVNQAVEYAASYNNSLGKLSPTRLTKMRVHAWVWVPSSEAKSSLVVEVKEPGTNKMLHSEYIDIIEFSGKNYHKWTELKKVITLPVEVTSNSLLKAYLWRGSSPQPVYLDDFQLERADIIMTYVLSSLLLLLAALPLEVAGHWLGVAGMAAVVLADLRPWGIAAGHTAGGNYGMLEIGYREQRIRSAQVYTQLGEELPASTVIFNAPYGQEVEAMFYAGRAVLAACGGNPAAGQYVGDSITTTDFDNLAGWGADPNGLSREHAHSGRFATFVSPERDAQIWQVAAGAPRICAAAWPARR
nr:hypothetical protein [Tanacetum cinerariifolium]